MCARVGAYCIRPSIIPNKNGQSFGDSWDIQSSLAGCLWGVSITTLHGYAYLIDGWWRCFYVGAYCIRPSIIPNENGQSFGDSLFIHSSLTGWLQVVCNTPLHGYTYWIDGWQGFFQVETYCIRSSIIPNKNGQSFEDSWSMQSSLAGCLWGVCNTPLRGYVYLIDGQYRCAHIWAYAIRPSIISNKNGQSFGDLWDMRSSLAGWLQGVCNTPLHGYAYLIDRWQGCFQVWAFCIRPSIIPNENGQSFGDSLFIHSSLTGCLQGVCNTPLPRYAHLIDGW